MTNDYSIPPLRDLPPGRLAQRAQHLHAEITRGQQTRFVMPSLVMPRLQVGRPGLVAVLAAVAALLLVPIGGASLANRAIDGISGIWSPGSPPPAPAPYQQGEKVWTTTPPVSSTGQFAPPAGYMAPQPPAAPPAYKSGDKVWNSQPPAEPQTTTTVTCASPSDAGKLLAKLESEGSPITSVECR
jgi:hypothetical protein